jgi:beta-glucanase (GH16 family)
MKSQYYANNTLSMPWILRKPKLGSVLILRGSVMRVLQQQLVSFVFIASIASVLIMTRNLAPPFATQRIAYPYASLFSTKALFNTRSTVAQKPSNPSAQAALAPTCTEPQSSIDGEPFAACPSFSLNFETQPKGAINTKDFNIYTGEPVANQEVELYTNSPKNLQVENGNLELKAQNDPEQGFNYTSARIDTQGKEDFLYGRIVVRATLPDGIGAWPAIWMLSSNNKYESLSPPSDSSRYLNDGEIDIAESVGTQPNVVYGIAHSLAYPTNGPNRNYYATTTVPGNDSTPHDYAVDWTPTNLTFTVDGKAYFSINKQPGANYQSWPYDQPFYLILNLALGGTWGGTDRAQFPTDGVDPSSLPATMKVQSINYYPYTGTTAASKN